MTGYTSSISNQTTSLRSTFEEHSLSIYCTSTRGTCTRQLLYNLHFHDLFTWLKLYPCTYFKLSSPASHRLDVVITIPVFNDCVLIVNFFQTYCHRVCLITRVLELDILFTSANVKTILVGFVSTSDVKTLRIDLDPASQLQTIQTTQSQCSTCWSRPHLGNSLPHLRLRQLSFFSSAAIRHDVFHHLPFDSSSPRESSGSRSPATPPVSCLARHHDG